MSFQIDLEKFKQFSGYQKEWGRMLLSEVRLTGAERVLDLGCGEGILTNELARMVPRGKAVGLDSSQRMIAAAQNFRHPNLSFILGDLNELAYENAFDLIFSNAALHYARDHGRTLALAKKALSAKGKLMWSFAADGNRSNLNSVVKKIMKKPAYEKWFADYVWPWNTPDVNEYTELLKQAKFRRFDVKTLDTDHHFRDADAVTAWIRKPAILPFLRVIGDENDKKSFLDETVSETLKLTHCGDGTYYETFRCIRVIAEK